LRAFRHGHTKNDLADKAMKKMGDGKQRKHVEDAVDGKQKKRFVAKHLLTRVVEVSRTESLI